MRKLVFVLAYVVLAAVACTPAQFGKEVLGDGGGQDGKAADVATPHTCPAETPSQSKGTAESCSCDRECRTGFCADGVCCNMACGQTCMACNLPYSLGVCAAVPWGATPDDPSVCSASTPATCGKDGTCDGKGACRLWGQGTRCKSGTCDGDSATGILSCDGKGTCSDAQPISQTCPPYTCDATTHLCDSSCTSDAQCSAGHQCVAGSCGKSANGADCTTGDGCASGFCVDGVCCNSGCAGECVSCNQTGSVGRCEPVPAGVKDSACIANLASTCGLSGVCDGFGSCARYSENTPCGPSSCAGLSEITPRTCDGKGTCRESGLLDCRPFLCANNACTNTCTTDQDCEDGYQCSSQTINGVTTPTCGPGQIGHVCAAASQCVSGQCVDGVCCESSCTGACRSCNTAGSPGRCLNAPVGTPDPRSTCKDLGAAACSTNGFCDGTGNCQNYAVGTACAPESCSAGVHTLESTCNASGQCAAPRSISCNPYVCNGSTCYSICTTTSNECVPGNFCVDSSCGLKPDGALCGTGVECQSTFCAQGVCCHTDCSAACMSCDLPATTGICTAVADKAPDPQGQCTETQPDTCETTGTCLKGVCAYYDQGSPCKDPVCASTSVAIPGSTCDGKGTCNTPASIFCGSFVCSSSTNACLNICTKDTDCNPPDTCVANSCGLKGNGFACTAAGQCQSGFCTEGVCCNTACADATSGGLCKTCKGTKTSQAGTCSNVDSGGSDPKSRCAQTNAGGGICTSDGTCDGSGACRAWSSSTGCRQASCTGSTLTYSANCDGKGGCPAATTSSCGSYECNPSSPTCLNTCKSNSDCTGGITCNTVTNKCGDKSTNGDTCNVATDCTSGYCVDGYCCNKACTDGCQSCKATPGTCLPIVQGLPPRVTSPATCPAAGSGVCGNTGNCDGNDACDRRSTCTPTITSCPTDTTSQYESVGQCAYSSTSSTCNLVTEKCSQAGYLCVASTNACGTSATGCKSDADCDASNGYSCIGGLCKHRAQGSACTADNQCTTGNCVDKYCCNSTCGTACSSCNVAGLLGTCSPVPINTADGTCTGSCPTQTQAAGLCDGKGGCQLQSSCAAGYICVDGLCGVSCSVDTDCATGYACVSGSSGKTCKKINGQTCGGGGDCASGNCVASSSGNICCATACPPAGISTCGNNNQCQIGGSACVDSDTETCNDGNACTKSDVCTGGKCGGTTYACAGPGTCKQAGTCNGDGTCSFANATDGTGCNDGVACTKNDVCTAGACAGTAYACAAPGTCKQAGTCNGDGTCSFANATDGTTCSDGSKCTQTDTCLSGSCVGGNPVVCPAPEQCHTVGTCEPTTGACSNPVNSGGSCGTPSCSQSNPPAVISAGTCQADGSCGGQTTTSCSGFTCSSGSCAASCTVGTNEGCATSYSCVGETECVPGTGTDTGTGTGTGH